MPEVYNNNLSTDIYIYELANIFALKNCYLNPNWVTATGFLVTIIIAILFYYNKSYVLIIILTIIRSVFDLLDGSVARKCNKVTYEGKIYDFLNDLFFYIILPFISFILIPDKFYFIKFIIIVIFITVLVTFFVTHNNGFTNLGVIFHDNYIISTVLYISLFYFLKEYFK